MKYVIFNLLEDLTPTTRFAKELAIQLDEAGRKVRVAPLGVTKMNGSPVFVSPQFFEDRYKKLVDLMWGPIAMGKEMYVFGDVKDVVNRILRRDDCAPKNYAFLTLAGWENRAERLALARGLMNYDRVFVFSESDKDELEKLNVQSDIVGDVSEYFDIESSEPEEEDTNRMLIVVPTDGTEKEEVLNLILEGIEAQAPENAATYLVELCKKEWNMSLARNLGIREAYLRGFDYVAFQDTDIMVPANYYREVQKLLSQSPDNVVVPNFVSMPSGKAGVASGNIALSVAKALEVDGYDESYVGGGSEDVDFLFRLSRDTVAFEVRPEGMVLEHADHAPRGNRAKWDKVNESRVKRVMDYEDLETKSILKDLSNE